MANMTIENIGGLVRDGNIDRIIDRGQSIQAPQAPDVNGSSSTEKPFTQMLKDSIENVNDMQMQADRAAKELAAGRNKNIHETMLMMEKADMSFRLMMQVRNKVIEAYHEIMRMQV